MSRPCPEQPSAADGSFHRLDEHMTELVLLLPAGQAEALEHLAQHWGLTVGSLLRRLIGGAPRRRTT
jgi:hypothetical protein